MEVKKTINDKLNKYKVSFEINNDLNIDVSYLKPIIMFDDIQEKIQVMNIIMEHRKDIEKQLNSNQITITVQ